MAKYPTRKKQMTRLSKLVDPMIEPTARMRGFVLSRLISQWNQVAGEMASWCQPVELKFNRGETSNGSLKLVIASGRGPEAIQQTEVIISRVNATFGYAAISRLSFVQTFQKHYPLVKKPKTAFPTSQVQRNEAIWALDEKLQQIESPQLRAALRRLGTPQDDQTG